MRNNKILEMKSKRRKAKPQESLPPEIWYVTDGAGRGELMLLEYSIRSNIAELEQTVAKVVKQLEACRSRLREFSDKLEKRIGTQTQATKPARL